MNPLYIAANSEPVHPESLAKLLELLGPNQDQAAIEYRRLHQRLSRFFEWNGADDPMALAVEAIDRLGKRPRNPLRKEWASPSPSRLGLHASLYRRKAAEKSRQLKQFVAGSSGLSIQAPRRR